MSIPVLVLMHVLLPPLTQGVKSVRVLYALLPPIWSTDAAKVAIIQHNMARKIS